MSWDTQKLHICSWDSVYTIVHNRKTSLRHPKKEALLISSSDEKLNILANE